ncbi:MAG: glycosyltransferase family 4 protein [Casimicrobiaceae bacterium]
MKPLRVLQVCTSFRPGGIQRHVLDLSAWLRSRGHDVRLAGTEGAWADRRSDAHFLPLDLDGVGGAGGTLVHRIAAAARASVQLRRFLRAEAIELVHAHESAPLLVAALASPVRSVPRIVTYHGSEPQRVAAFARLSQLVAHRVISPSRRTADALVRAGVSSTKLEVIGLGLAAAPALDAGDVAALRASLLPRNRRVLAITVARLAPQKGIDYLIAAIQRLGSVDVQFVVVGDGPLRASLRRLAVDAGVQERITFVGHRDDVPRYLAAADLFVLSSRWEALPLTIVEAMRAGLPVIATDTGGVPELVDASVGRVVPIGDVDALAESIRTLCEDSSLRQELAANARARAAEARFSPEQAHAMLEATYVRVVGARRTGRDG